MVFLFILVEKLVIDLRCHKIFSELMCVIEINNPFILSNIMPIWSSRNFCQGYNLNPNKACQLRFTAHTGHGHFYKSLGTFSSWQYSPISKGRHKVSRRQTVCDSLISLKIQKQPLITLTLSMTDSSWKYQGLIVLVLLHLKCIIQPYQVFYQRCFLLQLPLKRGDIITQVEWPAAVWYGTTKLRPVSIILQIKEETNVSNIYEQSNMELVASNFSHSTEVMDNVIVDHSSPLYEPRRIIVSTLQLILND